MLSCQGDTSVTVSERQYCCPELSDPPGELTQLLVRGSVDQDSDPMVCCWLGGQLCLYPFTSTFPLMLALVLFQAASELKVIHGFCWISEPGGATGQLKP